MDIEVNCCDVPDFDFSWSTSSVNLCPNGGCTISFTCPALDPDIYCTSWDMGDGTVYNGPPACPIHCYENCGVYTVCLTVYCCQDPNQSMTVCHDVIADCCCEVPTDVDFDWVSTGPCPAGDGCMIGFNCPQPLLDPDKYCVTWDFGDGIVQDFPTDQCPLHCYTDCGIYNVCMTVYCCEDPTQSVTVCHEVIVDCCCDLPADVDFTWLQTNPDICEYGFCPTGSTANVDDLCVHWDFGDGNVYDGPFAFCPIHVYQDCGVYNVCLTVYCCNEPNTAVTVCHEVVADCCCTVPDFISFTYFGTNGPNCEAGFCLDQVLDPTKYCSTWYWGDGTQSDHPVDVCPVHNYACDGIYDVCVDVYCCDDPSVRVTSCQTIEVDCPCNLPTNVDFLLSMDTECNVYGDILLPLQTCPDEICWTWDFGDGTGQVGGNNWVHSYPTSGVYTICLNVFCCDDSTVGYTICKDVQIDCCTVPDFISFTYYGTSGDNCQAGFCLDQILDPTKYCSTWYWGDGTQSDHPVDECPVHNYLCDGIYEVCVDVYCCDDPSVRVTSCQAVDIDCPCNLPSNVDFILSKDAECNVYGQIMLPDVTCPDEICWSWDFGDGTSQIGGDSWIHTYSMSGVYTVCLNVYCCDGSGLGYSVCYDVDVFCPPCQLPSTIGFDYVVDLCTVTTFGFWTDDYNGNICFEYNWGDGTPPTAGDSGTHTYGASGTYTICLTAFCCDDPSVSMTVCHDVTVNCGGCPEPCELHARYLWEMFPITQQDGCCMQFYDLSVAGTYTTISSWSWDFGDGTTSNLQNPFHCWSEPGTYTVCLTVTGSSPDGQCQDTFCWEVMCDCEDTCPADLNGDGFVNLSDLLIFLGQYNHACP
ncbi:MAG: PKD domain-containing protein [Flavobacteriales bacterium]|nr:PKD domain-containing protein [Flavobacteriales bacterium]